MLSRSEPVADVHLRSHPGETSILNLRGITCFTGLRNRFCSTVLQRWRQKITIMYDIDRGDTTKKGRSTGPL